MRSWISAYGWICHGCLDELIDLAFIFGGFGFFGFCNFAHIPICSYGWAMMLPYVYGLARGSNDVQMKTEQTCHFCTLHLHTMASQTTEDEIQDEIALLESRLNEAKARLSALHPSPAAAVPCK